MTDELKPCPICGGTGIPKYESGGYYVECLDCGIVFGNVFLEDATGCFEYFDTEEAAINAWNNEPRT